MPSIHSLSLSFSLFTHTRANLQRRREKNEIRKHGAQAVPKCNEKLENPKTRRRISRVHVQSSTEIQFNAKTEIQINSPQRRPSTHDDGRHKFVSIRRGERVVGWVERVAARWMPTFYFCARAISPRPLFFAARRKFQHGEYNTHARTHTSALVTCTCVYKISTNTHTNVSAQ